MKLPFLLGEITSATISIDQTDIDIWTYSATNVNTSSDIKFQIEEVMHDAKAFQGFGYVTIKRTQHQRGSVCRRT